MRIFIDTEFPPDLLRGNTTDIELIRWNEAGTDSALVEAAAQQGCAAVAVVGRDHLANASLIGGVTRWQMALIVVSDDDPIQAGRNLLQNLHRLARVIRPGIFVVSASQTREFERESPER